MPRSARLARTAAAVLLLALAQGRGGAVPAAAAQEALTVFAASSLTFAFEAIAPRFEEASGVHVTLVFGSTGNLAKQIEHGAPADVFFAADVGFVRDLEAKGAVVPGSRTVYARGRLALVTERRSGLALRRLADLLEPDVRRVAIANPAHAPYGRAAREALEATGLWEALRPKLVYGETVRQALQFVQSGAAQAGLVALSVADVPEVTSAPVDPSLHDPIDQAAAVTVQSRRPDLARAFIRFVVGPEGGRIMVRHGFGSPQAGSRLP